ncbi:MAG: hypothetical protein KC656_12580, partial [Myxococcales bacterium]|nr:hypothetical protein [Myxococcales bacterium]
HLAPEVSGHLHVNLFPEPYAGDIRSAPVVILMKNPGFHQRLYEEHASPAYLEAMRRNLEQRHDAGERRLFWFRPEFIMHGGFQYFGARFAPLLREGDSPQAALDALDRTVCVVQMTGYTSQASPSGLDRLPSTQAVFRWLREEVLPSVRMGHRALVIARAKREWTPHLKGPHPTWEDARKALPSDRVCEETTRIPSFDPARKGAGELVSRWMKRVVGSSRQG